MRVVKAIKRYIRTPRKLILTLGMKGWFNWVPDRLYLKLIYWGELGENLNLNEPVTYNEKLQWLKLNDRNPEYNIYVDKYAVRLYIEQTIGQQYLIPLIAVYDKVEEIDWESLPNKFILKCTHGSGSNVICIDKDKLDKKAAIKKLDKWMKKNWYWFGREWPYLNVKPRIVCEKYMVDESGKELKDYKIFCFNGEPKIIQVDYNRFKGHKRNLYDTDWNYIPASLQYPTDSNVKIKKPEKLNEMLELARTLSKDYPHVRIDFYYINGKIYFGEITFYHGAGLEMFNPEEFGLEMGSWIALPKLKQNTTV
ncbi:ATP-grasp fold amidoligase family protein [Peribacillus frigoritolerans]|uniref:ATP-grasp fold amidoligase family protein n=1 Tax=Peribacillus castrilensis TaxID=2897690 RepID=UPI002DCC2532|nr:ATP-grasp fold amidoligase family protein [Peribacillus castrilensis]